MKKHVEIIKRGKHKGLIVIHNFIDLNWRNRDLDHSINYMFYLVVIETPWKTVKYIGYGKVVYNQDGSTSSKSRILSHKNDELSRMIERFGPEYCKVYTIEGLTKREAKLLESIAISGIEGSMMFCGEENWSGEDFLNKRHEVIDLGLKEKLLGLDGNNSIETFRRKINRYQG